MQNNLQQLLIDNNVDMLVRRRNEKDETLGWTAYIHKDKSYSRDGNTPIVAINNLLSI